MKQIITRRSLLAASAGALLAAPAVMAMTPVVSAPSDEAVLLKALHQNIGLTQSMITNKTPGEPWTEHEDNCLRVISKQRCYILKLLGKIWANTP